MVDADVADATPDAELDDAALDAAPADGGWVGDADVDDAALDATCDGSSAIDGSVDDGGVDGDAADGGAPARAELLYNADGRNDRYAGIGRAIVPQSCTATLLDVGGTDASPAYALTAGHCTGWWDSDRAWVDRALDDPGTVIFRFFTDTVDAQHSVAVAVAAYASMRLTDLALLRLDTTVGALRAAGIEGLPLARALPAESTPVVNIGAPLPDDPSDGEHLRRGACTLGPTVNLVEFEWLWPGTVVHDCPDIRVGSSGSPLLDASGAIVAVVHTNAFEPEHAACYLNSPCELAPQGPVWRGGRGYAIAVSELGACFVDGTLALDEAGCPLEAGPLLATRREVDRYVRPSLYPNLTVTALTDHGMTHYRAKAGPAQSTDCTSDDGYGEVRAIAAEPSFAPPLPTQDGLTVACLRGGSSENAIAPASQAIAWLVATDSTPPALPLPVEMATVEDGVEFSVFVENPTYASYRQKSGPAQVTDCADPSGYAYVNVRFGRFTVAVPAGEQTRVCLTALDFADNESAPMQWLLGG